MHIYMTSRLGVCVVFVFSQMAVCVYGEETSSASRYTHLDKVEVVHHNGNNPNDPLVHCTRCPRCPPSLCVCVCVCVCVCDMSILALYTISPQLFHLMRQKEEGKQKASSRQ